MVELTAKKSGANEAFGMAACRSDDIFNVEMIPSQVRCTSFLFVGISMFIELKSSIL